MEVMVGLLAEDPKMASGNGQTTQQWSSKTSLLCALPLIVIEQRPRWSITPSYSREITSGDMWPLDLRPEWATSVKTWPVKSLLMHNKIHLSMLFVFFYLLCCHSESQTNFAEEIIWYGLWSIVSLKRRVHLRDFLLVVRPVWNAKLEFTVDVNMIYTFYIHCCNILIRRDLKHYICQVWSKKLDFNINCLQLGSRITSNFTHAFKKRMVMIWAKISNFIFSL